MSSYFLVLSGLEDGFIFILQLSIRTLELEPRIAISQCS